MDHYYWGIGALDVASEVTVPAGTFRDVIKNVTAFNAEDFTTTILARSKVLFREPGDLNEPAFVTESYYAKDVGLIKELQYGRDGQATYEMVLLSYELH